MNKKFWLGTALSVTLGIGAAWGIAQVFPAINNVAEANQLNPVNEVGTQSVKDSLKSLPFKVKQPKHIPFTVTDSYAQVSDLGENIKYIEITYINAKTQEFMIVTATQANTVPISDKYTIKKGNKVKGQFESDFLDNDKVQILYWKQDGVSYSIKASSGNKNTHYTSEELENIAESLE